MSTKKLIFERDKSIEITLVEAILAVTIACMTLNNGTCICSINPLPDNATFDTLKIYSCGKHCEKRKIDCNKQFSFSHNVSYPKWHLFFILNAL